MLLLFFTPDIFLSMLLCCVLRSYPSTQEEARAKRTYTSPIKCSCLEKARIAYIISWTEISGASRRYQNNNNTSNYNWVHLERIYCESGFECIFKEQTNGKNDRGDIHMKPYCIGDNHYFSYSKIKTNKWWCKEVAVLQWVPCAREPWRHMRTTQIGCNRYEQDCLGSSLCSSSRQVSANTWFACDKT